ncbi:hypothetical protein ABZP36_011409 [Zizania latifolia]
MGAGGAVAAPRKEKQRSAAAGHWSEMEEGAAAPKRRARCRAWSCGVNVVLAAAFVMTVPPMVVVLIAARDSAPAIWISSVNVLRRGDGTPEET